MIIINNFILFILESCKSASWAEQERKEELNNNNASIENIDRNNKIKRIGQLDCIDRNILNELVDVIYVTESRCLEVVFKYKNLYEYAMKYLKS